MNLLPDGMDGFQATAVHKYYSRDKEVRQPLRVGVLLDGYIEPAWVEHVLKRITSEDFAELALVIINDSGSGSAGPRRNLARRAAAWWRNRHTLGYELYQRLDERRYQGDNAPGRLLDLAPLLASVPVMRVQPRMTRFCDFFQPTDLERIAGYDLDVALRFGFRILRGGALQIARHGVWSYHHGDNTVNRGGPAGFWEVMEEHEVTGAVLQRLTEDLDGGEVIGRSYSSTNRISSSANRANYYWQATELVIGSLRELAEQERNDERADKDKKATPLWSAYTRRLYTRPGSVEMLGHFMTLAKRLVAAKIHHLLVREQWLLAYRLATAPDPAGVVPDGVFYRFRELQPPPDRFWADPFPVSATGRHYIFFEEQPYDKPYAHICVVEVDAAGIKGQPRVALRRPYHLSYPSVFEWQGEWYMTPETQARNAVELFHAVNFPDQWEYVGNLIEGIHAVDPTIALIDDRWWMFAGVAVAGTREATALHLFSAPGPLGPWQPHARNPVKIDVRGARPGGQVFRSGGRYYRVGQDGTPNYGSGLRVFVIDQIDEDTFRETEVERIRPGWRKGLVGMHTLNAAEGITVIDLRQERRRF